MNLKCIFCAAAAALTAFCTTAGAAPRFLCCDQNGGRVCVVSADGKVDWDYPCKAPQDCWMLANGNRLFCFVSGALELTTEKTINQIQILDIPGEPIR